MTRIEKTLQKYKCITKIIIFTLWYISYLIVGFEVTVLGAIASIYVDGMYRGMQRNNKC